MIHRRSSRTTGLMNMSFDNNLGRQFEGQILSGVERVRRAGSERTCMRPAARPYFGPCRILHPSRAGLVAGRSSFLLALPSLLPVTHFYYKNSQAALLKESNRSPSISPSCLCACSTSLLMCLHPFRDHGPILSSIINPNLPSNSQ
jgi:hypothetical protein